MLTIIYRCLVAICLIPLANRNDFIEQIKLTESLKVDLKEFVNKDGENND